MSVRLFISQVCIGRRNCESLFCFQIRIYGYLYCLDLYGTSFRASSCFDAEQWKETLKYMTEPKPKVNGIGAVARKTRRETNRLVWMHPSNPILHSSTSM